MHIKVNQQFNYPSSFPVYCIILYNISKNKILHSTYLFSSNSADWFTSEYSVDKLGNK